MYYLVTTNLFNESTKMIIQVRNKDIQNAIKMLRIDLGYKYAYDIEVHSKKPKINKGDRYLTEKNNGFIPAVLRR